MGGSINVAVRLKSGEAYCNTIWTNECPSWFKNVRMLEGDEDYVRSFLDMDRYKNDNYYGKKSRVCNSEYGLIVWDYKSNIVFENNGYTSLDSIMVYEANNRKTEFKELVLSGRIRHRSYDIKQRATISDVLDYDTAMRFVNAIKPGFSWDDFIIDTYPMRLISFNEGPVGTKAMKKLLMEIDFPMTKAQGLNLV